MASASVTYLSPGLFDMGGIARYGRYQVRALRELLGTCSVRVHSMLAPTPEGFDDPFEVDAVAGGTDFRHKLNFVGELLTNLAARGVYWSAHLNYAPLVVSAAAATRGQCVTNIYGLEVWSDNSRLRAAALRRSWVVSDCQATLDAAVELGLVNPARACVIHDPVDLNIFKPGNVAQEVADRYGIVADGRFRVLFLARLTDTAKYKSPDVLLRAFARAELPGDSQLVIAGSGDRLDALRRLAGELGVSERVCFPGRIADSDLPSIYRLASLFVLVSRRTPNGGEGIPLTPLEAAACGVPIVVGNEDGSREACIHEESGFVLPSRDEDALRALLERASRTRDAMREVGRAAATRMRDMFSFERFVEDHRVFLERIGVPTLQIETESA